MAKMTRFGVSLEEGLLEKFDAKIEKAGYRNRSAALRDLVRHYLKAGKSAKAGKVFAVVILTMRSNSENLKLLAELKKALGDLVKGSQSQYPEGDYFLDVSILYGDCGKVKDGAERLQGLKGILSSSCEICDMLPPCHS